MVPVTPTDLHSVRDSPMKSGLLPERVMPKDLVRGYPMAKLTETELGLPREKMWDSPMESD